MATIDDIIDIELKSGEKFTALKLESIDIPGFSDKVHMHIMRLLTFDREILPINKIASINGKPLSAPKTSWIVEGSKSNKYTVTFNGMYKCTCMGYKFNKSKPKTCSHIEKLIAEKV